VAIQKIDGVFLFIGGTNLPRSGRNKCRVALICHLLALICRIGGTELSRGGKNKRSVALKFATLAKGGTELSHGGRNKCRNLKGGKYIVYTIYMPPFFLQELQKPHNFSCAVTLTPSELMK